MNYVTANQIVKDTDTLFTKGIDTGLYLGFNTLSDFYRVKLGCTTYIGGIPSHGKTEFHFELLMSLSELYGFKHALFSPESGLPCDIVGELAHKYIGQPYSSPNGFKMSQADKYKADAWLSEYYYIMTPDEKGCTVDELLKTALEIKQKHGLHTFSIDPFNELTHDYSQHGGREDKYLEYTLGKIRRFARDNNVHIFIIAHPRTLKPVDGVYQPPTAFELSGGAAWYAKAETILCVHRPDMTGNKVEIHIQKTKPKHTGKKGVCTLHWDWKKSRYYEEDGTAIRYSSPKQQKSIQPNTSFIQDESELPF